MIHKNYMNKRMKIDKNAEKMLTVMRKKCMIILHALTPYVLKREQ